MHDREIIMGRLLAKSVSIAASRTAAFSTTIPAGKIRNIVVIFLIGDGTASRTVNFEKLESDGSTYTMKFQSVPIAPADVRILPPSGYDIENPILTLEEATNLYLTASAGTPYASILYWDSER